MRSTKKSQAALEYLLVYGAAIVIVLIAVAYLYVLFYSPQTKIPNTCTFSGGATCADLVLGINAVTSNTAILLLLNNAGDSYIQNPMAKASIIGVNTSWFGCIPSSVEEGGSIVCLINLTKKYGVGQAVSGTVFLSEQNCAFSSLGGCQNPVNQIYSGTFYGTTEIAGPPIFKVTVSQQTAQGLGSMVPIIAYVTLNGFPLKGITVNFTSNTPSVTPTPHYVSTDSSGQATTYISHTLPGGTAIYANVSNTIASKVAGTTSTSTSSTSTSTSTSSTSTSTSTSTTSTSTLHYLSFTVTNTNTVAAVPSGFQQQISFNPSSYSGNEISDLGNIRFYQGATPLYSWCESGCTSGSSNAVFWIALNPGIAANSNVAVNAILTSNSEYDGIYAGEAPQLSGTYGQFDNGNSIFSFYDDFIGTTLKSTWSNFKYPSGTVGTNTVNNGVTFTGGSTSWWGIKNTYQVSSPDMLDYYTDVISYYGPGIGTYTGGVWFEQRTADTPKQWGIESSSSGGAVAPDIYSGSSAYNTWYLVSGQYVSGNMKLITNYATTQVSSSYSASTSNLIISVFPSTENIKVQWIRVRTYPLGGAMPTVSAPSFT